MKRISLLLSLLLIMALQVGAAHPQITSFDDLMKTLNAGGHVRVVFHYAKCTLISDNENQEKVPDAIGGMDIGTYEYFAPNSVKNKEAFVVFSENKLIEYPKGDGYVYNYAKVKIEPNNKVKITARYLDAKTMEDKMDENFFGLINDGKNDGGVFLYGE
jgi:hypothetical protein